MSETLVLSPAAHPGQHGHQVDLEVGLDFVNTLEFTRAGLREHVTTANEALHWLRDHGLMHEDAQAEQLRRVADDPDAAERLLTKVQKVRGAMRELADATVNR
ncbi:MAG: ABATE domain-containing protein, partial [Candidatus Limnocylindria bacterium]